jgi:hypothetical protein
MPWLDRRGFEFAEIMEGTYARVELPDDRRPLRFAAHVHAPSIRDYLRSGHAAITGTLDAEGFATQVPFTGTMLLRPFTQGRIGYALDFVADDGRAHVLRGEKHIRLTALVRTFTELHAEIRDAASDRLVATSDIRFDLQTQLVRFVRSWRLV